MPNIKNMVYPCRIRVEASKCKKNTHAGSGAYEHLHATNLGAEKRSISKE